MEDPKVIYNKVIFGPCRLINVSLFDKHNFDGNYKYTVTILIPKNEALTITAINDAIRYAQGMFSDRYGYYTYNNLTLPLGDGDERDDETYAGHWYINAKSNAKPGVVDRDRNIITDEEEVYSGMWGLVSVSFYGYDKGVNKGIAAAINNVMKTDDGTPIVTYKDKLNDERWRKTKKRILKRDGNCCYICKRFYGEKLVVHHKTYDRVTNRDPWTCPDSDLVTLCDECHEMLHSVEKSLIKRQGDDAKFYELLDCILKSKLKI